MNVSDEANKLRVDLVRLGSGHARRYPPGMKQLILTFVERAKEAGMAVSESCRRIGITPKQLTVWRAERRATEPKALVPVRVTEARAPIEQLAIVAPNGYRVEGASLEQVIELMRALA